MNIDEQQIKEIVRKEIERVLVEKEAAAEAALTNRLINRLNPLPVTYQ